MNRMKKTYVTYVEWIFKSAYLLLGIASFNPFLYDSPVQPMLVKVCLFTGILALAGRLVYFKDYKKTPYWWLLVMFCISFLISILANRSYGVMVADIKWLIWTGFLFFILYVCDGTRTKEAYQKEFRFFSHIMILYSSVAGVLGLIHMQTLYHAKWYTENGEMMLSGFHWGRLWGIYSDPNYGGVLSTLSILFCIYYVIQKKGWKKIPYGIGILLNYLYILFCDSRTAVLSLVISGIFWILFSGIRYHWNWKKAVAGITSALLLSFVLIGGISQVKTEYCQELQKKIKRMDANSSSGTSVSDTGGREEDLKKDVSNGRLALWESGIEVWATSPIIGTGYNSFLPYAKEHTPNTYAVTAPSGGYTSLHNEYLNILVYQGVVGFGILLIFGILSLRKWIRNLKHLSEADVLYAGVLCSCVLTVGIAMLFLMEGMHTNSPGSFVLWTFLGYLMHMTQTENSKNQSKVEKI